MGCISLVSFVVDDSSGKVCCQSEVICAQNQVAKKTIKRRATTIKHDIFLRAADGSPFLQLQLCSFAHYPPGTWPEVSLDFNIPRNFDAKPTTDSLTHRLTAPPASPSISPTFIHYYKHCKTRQRPGISCFCLFVFYVILQWQSA